MTYFYSPSRNGFFTDTLKSKYGDNWPDDAKELNSEQVEVFIRHPRVDKAVEPDSNGYPSWGDLPPLKKEEKTKLETSWRDSELYKVLNRIDQYEKDQNYPEELKTSPIRSHDDFVLLLNDRKVLSDYPNSESFPFGERPILSGLV